MNTIQKLLCVLICGCAILACTLFSPRSKDLSTSTGNGSEPAPTPLPDVLKGYFLPDPSVGLNALASYHQELTVTFQGKNGSQIQDEKEDAIHDYQRQPHVDFITSASLDENRQPVASVVGDLGGAHYLRPSATDPCTVYWDDNQTVGAGSLNPALRLPPIKKATQAGDEAVNGVSARHYRVSYSVPKAQEEGEFWLANPGGYVVRYTLTIQGQTGFFGPGIEGERRYQYDLSQVNSVLVFNLPADCPAVLTEVPAIKDAVNLSRKPHALDYLSPSPVSTIGAFYRQSLVGLGWKLTGDDTRVAQEEILDFTRNQGLHELAITLVQDGTQTVVNLVELGSESATPPPLDATGVPAEEMTPPADLPTISTLPVDNLPPAVQTMVATMLPKP